MSYWTGNIRYVFALLVLTATSVLFYLGATSLSTVFGSRHAYRPSPDADGKVELVFRYSKTSKNPKPSEWRLKIPKQYADSVVGNLESVGPSDSSYVNLVGKGNLLDSVSRKFEPTNDLTQPYIFIRLNNKAAVPGVIDYGGCLSTTVPVFILQKADLRACEAPNCRIYDSIDGWNTEYSVPKLLATNPQPVCKLLRQFLNSHTEYRDNISN